MPTTTSRNKIQEPRITALHAGRRPKSIGVRMVRPAPHNAPPFMYRQTTTNRGPRSLEDTRFHHQHHHQGLVCIGKHSKHVLVVNVFFVMVAFITLSHSVHLDRFTSVGFDPCLTSMYMYNLQCFLFVYI